VISRNRSVQNDGHGHFTEPHRQWLDEPHAAGMAHAVADFDTDAFPISCHRHAFATVDRGLAHLGSARPGFPMPPPWHAAHAWKPALPSVSAAGGFRTGSMGDSMRARLVVVAVR